MPLSTLFPGALDRLHVDRSVLVTDMTDFDAVCGAVLRALSDPAALRAMSAATRADCMAWGVEECGGRLFTELRDCADHHASLGGHREDIEW